MQPSPYKHQNSRINVTELKAQVVKKLGQEESKQYFYYLNRFLSLKLRKVEFNKLCLRIVGRDNINLHNQLIRSILRNSCLAKVPPDSVLKNGCSPCKNRALFLDPNHRASDFITSLENRFLQENRSEINVRTSSKSPILAPLGIRFCHGGVPITKSSPLDNVLLDSLTLRDRMEKISASQGLEGVSMDSANVLNRGLDSYMKGLIRACVEHSGARSRHDVINSCTKLVNGISDNQCLVSFYDFKVAMELNPRKLGLDWPLLLEKICNAFQE